MEKIVTQNLLAIVRTYRKATGASWVKVSKEFYGNAYFFDEMRKGTRTPSVRQVAVILDKLRDRWPDGVPWPATRPILMCRNPQR